jgi:hypothetical protein
MIDMPIDGYLQDKETIFKLKMDMDMVKTTDGYQ